jgi:hypothetical protein
VHGSWSPDGTRLALATVRSGRIDVDVVEIQTGAAETIHTGGWHPVWLSPSRIAFVDELGPDQWDGHLALIDPATRATTVLPGGPHVRGFFGFSRLDAHGPGGSEPSS